MAIETLDSKLSKIMFHKPGLYGAGAKYLIARTSCGHTVKGSMDHPIEGLRYRFFGEWREQKGRDETAFEFITFQELIDSGADGLTTWLRKKVDGLGHVKAQAIVDHFGDDALKIMMADPERLGEVRGIAPASVESIRKCLADRSASDPAAWVAVASLLAGHRVPDKVVEAIVKDWGASAAKQIREYPYSTLIPYRGLGWTRVDAIAMTNLGYDRDGLDRHCAAIEEAVSQVCNDLGHTYAAKIEANGRAHELLGVRPKAEAWEKLDAEKRIVTRSKAGGDEVSPADLHDAELSIAWRIERLALTAKPLAATIDGDGLEDDQKAAAEMIAGEGVCILAGAPGTGKSFSMAHVINSLRENGQRGIRVAAPTGKAAKRAAELIAKATGDAGSIPCTTIHRALAPSPSDAESGTPVSSAKVGRGRDEFMFAKNEANPLDVTVLFLDEVSMVDTKLAAATLRAVPDGARVVFVGDPNQLPSVGPGSVLRDLIASGLPCVTLEKIVRSDGGGRVVKACHAIKAGRRPEPAERTELPTENWVHIELEDQDAIAEEIVNLCKVRKAFPDPVWDIQVVSPIYKGPIGCNALNERLGKHLNPVEAGETGDDAARWPFDFRANDKMVRTKNGAADELTEVEDGQAADFHWRGAGYRVKEIPVVNGDMGTVLDFIPDGKDSSIVVRFRDPDRLCRVPSGEHHLQPAYAITCHKAQGSGFPMVIVPVHQSFPFNPQTERGVWTREWIYTAISRAEKLLVTVGQASAITKAINRRTIHQRNTLLADRIRLALPMLEGAR